MEGGTKQEGLDDFEYSLQANNISTGTGYGSKGLIKFNFMDETLLIERGSWVREDIVSGEATMVPELDGVSAGVDDNPSTENRIWRCVHIFRVFTCLLLPLVLRQLLFLQSQCPTASFSTWQ